MELATEDHSGLIGSCDRDYGCIYMNTLSWRTPETPLPMEINPRKVFERMFGQGGSAAERAGAHPGRPQHPRRHHARGLEPAAPARAVRSPDDEAVSGERARDRAPHPARREEPGRRGSPAAGASRRRAVRLRGARRADVRADGAGLSGEHHPRHHLHGVARGQQPDLHAGRRHRRPPRDLAPPEPRREDGKERPHPDVQHHPVQGVPRQAAERCPTATAPCSITRCSSTAAT